MRLKLLSTAAAATLFAAGAAFAQETSATGKNAPEFATEQEGTLYEENAFLRDFFTDETMTEMRSEDEFQTAYEGLSDQDRDNLIAACESAMQDRGSYGNVTLDMCTRVQGM